MHMAETLIFKVKKVVEQEFSLKFLLNYNTLVAKITENNGINISEVTDEDIEEAKN